MDLDQKATDLISNGVKTNQEQSSETPTIEKQTETDLGVKMEINENQEPQLQKPADGTSASYSKEEMDAFMLQPFDVDNPEMQDAVTTLIHEAMFPSVERHQVAVMDNLQLTEETLSVDYEKELVQIGNMTINSAQIRFSSLNRIEDTKHGYEVVVSYVTKDNKTRLLHILCPDNAKILVGVLNSFRRLTYMLYKKLLATVQEFGKALKKSLPLFTGSVQNVSLYNLETTQYEVEKKSMYLCLDSECLMILQLQFCEESPYQMYFWKEAVTDSVDRVLVLHEKSTIFIETQKMRLEIPHYLEGQANSDLFQCVRSLKPEPQGSFTDHAGRLQKIRNPVKSPADGLIVARALPGNTPDRSSLPLSRGPAEPQESYSDNKVETDNIRLKSFRDDLHNAVSKFENQEEIALPWVIAEDEIRRMLDEGFVPETDILSGGLNPNSVDHFMKCEEEIEDQLVQQHYDRALSRLQGTKKIFMECGLHEMNSLLSIEDITLLKQMYFHSFT